MKKLLFIALFGSISFFSTAQSSNIEESVEQLRQLMVDPNESGLKAISHFKLTYGHSSGKIENRDEFIRALLSKESDFTEIKLSDQSVETIGKTAIVRHSLSAKTLDNGKEGTVNLKVMTVWLKQKKGWVLFGRQAVR